MDKESREAFDRMVNHVDELKSTLQEAITELRSEVATKNELEALRANMNFSFGAVQANLESGLKAVATKEDIHKELAPIEADMATKENVLNVRRMDSQMEDDA